MSSARLIASCLAAFALLASSGASAQTTVQPYFLVIFDTSGSMQTGTGAGNNSCGQAHTRLSDAKCVVQNVINGYGEINFGLERFRQTCTGSCSGGCSFACGTCDCNDTCDASANSGQILVPIVPDNQADITRWVDFSCGTCGTSLPSNPELQAPNGGLLTPLGGSLRAARAYFEGNDANFPSPIQGDAFAGCRPYAVILLTDGIETCGGDPAAAATELRTTNFGGTNYDVPTYVIGFGILSGDDQIESIAVAGGTDAPGAYRGFYASDEQSLALAFSQIVADNILFETCDMADNDCDGNVDEGFTLYCDRPAGNNPPPTLCVDPGERDCDGQDDNCNGQVDEGLTNACGTCGPPPLEACNGADDDCDGAIDEGVCGTCVPSSEICDNADNDCDMIVDEDLMRPCGTDTGECTTGNETCSAGTWGMCSGQGPVAELCDGLDNDCDGQIDGQTRPCGTDVGACVAGVETCTGPNTWSMCTATGGSGEVCNGVDDDCDGSIDEGNPGGGAACGTNTGECTAGVVACMGGALVCSGGVSPSPEVCNGDDDDCDGNLDEEVPTNGSCGSDVGACEPGLLTCQMGTYQCVGATTGGPETCNGVDDDCDASTDENNPGGGASCGTDEGTCVSGTLACMGGALVCSGGVSPGVEVCNGDDDDCDAATDEGVPTNGSCGTSEGECRLGVNTCVSGAYQCVGNFDGGPEVCDGRDNDCDASTDENNPGGGAACGSSTGQCDPGTLMCNSGALVCNGATGPSAETCNGDDDDCDGATDEDVPTNGACGNGTGECRQGVNTCVSGAYQCVGSTSGGSEICDGLDNDCDGSTDENNPGGGGTCGSGIGECEPGTLLCSGGALICDGATGQSPEVCDGLDNDCDGSIDDGVPTNGPCGSSVGECRQGVDTCVGGTFQCVGARGPVNEVCDSRDNDCDSSTDENNPGGGVTCGTDTGECATGSTACVGGTLMCQGDTGPAPEACNTLDDDCDGLFDESNPGGGGQCGATDEGLCDFGAEACVSGALVCIGESGPSAEICDGFDNDCDGLTDEGNPEAGGACGDDTGECMAGTFQCTGGELVCQGAVGPTPELCDGLDNDCDGLIDDGIPVGAPCGSSVGECVPGVNVCRDGLILCEGEIAPEAESCDLLDNDCDGATDEGIGIMGTCGSQEGLCMQGMQRCVSGRLVCEGEVRPGRETCDCSDNDCDGAIDEDPDLGSLCPDGSSCVDCQCALPCDVSEFGFRCPTGRTPLVQGETCFCVEERCQDEACAAETVTMDDVTACAPDSADVANCVCRNNECTFSCNGVTCDPGTVCDPRDPDGRCVVADCTGLGCGAGEVCDVATGECEADLCATITCGDGEACREGVCEGSCAGVECPDGQACRAGSCQADACATVSCDPGQVCDPADGSCVDDLCADITCPAGQVCEFGTGNCVADPCNDLRCPEGEMCEDGQCVGEEPMGVDAGPPGFDGGTGPDDSEEWVLAAGGCLCKVGAQPSSPTQAPWLFVLGLLGLVVARRRRRARASRPLGSLRVGSPRARAALAALFALLVGGCEIDPFCLTCGEMDGGDAGPVDGGMDAATRDGGDEPEDAGLDGSTEDASLDGGIEICNGEDDDQDGLTDEGFDTQTDLENCGGCGEVCAPIGAFPVCEGGECLIDRCDVGRLDVNEDPSDGCEYRCLVEADDDTICDRRDNDCDTLVDEDVDTTMDVEHCGACGFVCGFPHAAASCGDSMCQLGACDPGFHDLDGDANNGCEYSCTPADPPDEVCNLVDDDCDGTLDEGNPGGGGGCGSDVGECALGVEECVGGTIVCTGETVATTELCNGVDDDCDGSSDEGDPEGGRLCGTGQGACENGREVCQAGALVCTGGVESVPETCDGLDNDCDGTIDESNPEGGGACGASDGECVPGTLTCLGGVLACENATGPVAEICNGLDDDCDGLTDEGDPGGGGSCGTDVGTCTPGTLSCTGGAIVCTGQVGAGTETCNSLDDDCDGSVDESNPGGGASCGTDTGECSFGTLQCLGGALSCQGGTGPAPSEQCNTLDDDCDGNVDEGNPGGGGTCGTDVGQCSFGTRQCQAGAVVCVGGSGPAPSELCNTLDDDCDGNVDEGNPGGGASCGNDAGECSFGTQQCVGGAIVCSGGDGPASETCNGLDDDCDGSTDENNPGGGANCGTNVGQCSFGTRTCTGGALVCQGGTGGGPETCNSLDDDCDGSTDEGNPGGGASCGSNVGECSFGTQTCSGGAIVCQGSDSGGPETCNGLDDDCDGMSDENNPEGGSSCGTDVGACDFGMEVCSGGALVCQGGSSGGAETCNGFDDDCDSLIDEGNPGGGASCGNDTGACTFGTQTCSGGVIQCSGGTGPAFEACDSTDNDCDGAVDEGYNTTSDPNNCGGCGIVCPNAPNATRRCMASTCSITCNPGFVDLDGPANGCEYECSVNGNEICNGADDDCDGVTDEGLTPPMFFCNPNGVCAGTTPSCGGAGGWECNYPGSFEQTETSCDGLDNDCDGGVDEPFPLVGTSCDNGEIGACRINGMYQCNTAEDGVECTAGPSGGGTAESCNNLDDDCDGMTDEYAPNDWIPFTAGALGTRYIFAYEASRPDGTSGAQGSATHRACSAPGRLPWTNVTYPQAAAACEAVGGRLCEEVEWQEACESSTNSCDWSYAASCSSYQPNTCNGNDYDTIPGGGDDDGPVPGGSLTSCRANWGGANRAFDMSGNVEEWTREREPGVSALRGGANNDTAGGLMCGFDFVVAPTAISLPTVGFRCCRSTPPSCIDGVQNGAETAVDCGGGSCLPCDDGQACSIAADCESSVCTSNTCQAPTCSDGVLNGSETDTDCGGSCAACTNGGSCQVAGDCTSGNCLLGTCATCGTGNLRISEIYGGSPDYIEIRNYGTCNVNANTVSVRFRMECDGSVRTHAFSNYSIPGGGTFRLVDDSTPLVNEDYLGANICHNPNTEGWASLCLGATCSGDCSDFLDYVEVSGGTNPASRPACASFTPGPVDMSANASNQSATRTAFNGGGNAGLRADYSIMGATRDP